MDRDFRSKVDWWYHLVMGMAALGCIAAFLQAGVWPMIAMVAATTLIIHVFLNTWYRVTSDGFLVVHCSIFPEKKIAIAEIQALEPTMMPASSYALSLDRLIVWTEKGPWMLISPRNKKEFIQILREINPEISLKKEDIFL